MTRWTNGWLFLLACCALSFCVTDMGHPLDVVDPMAFTFWVTPF